MRPPREPTSEDRLSARTKPDQHVLMYQRWRDLLFLHWSVEPVRVQSTLPPGLHVDTYEGRAYIGIVPFFMRGVRPRFLPPVRGVSNFMELNLRTYVHDGRGTPGVWFYSLEANQQMAVTIARFWFGLPYHYAEMESSRDPERVWIDYRCRRRGADGQCHYRYRSVESLPPPEPGSLEFFLIERYVLFAKGRGGLWEGRVHHEPYPLRKTHVSRWDARLFEWNDLEAPGRDPDHLLYSPGVNVDIYSPRRVSSDGSNPE